MKSINQTPGLVVAIGDRPDAKEGDGNIAVESSAQNVDTIPLDSLAMPDDQEQMQPPEVGDEVNYQVTGKVVSIEGNMAKVERTSINGKEVESEQEESNETPQDEADESQGLRDQAGGMGMMMSVILFLAILLAPSAFAESTKVTGNATFTNSLIAASSPTKLYSLLGYNSSASTQYIQVFQTNGVPANGAIPVFSMPVPTLQFYCFDFSFYGADLDAITICSSTTPDTLTISASNTSFQAITKSK